MCKFKGAAGIKTFWACLCGMCLLLWLLDPHPLDKKESFIQLIHDPNRFFSRIQKGPSSWMQEQLSSDFNECEGRKITLESLDKTYSRIPSELKNCALGVVRYRILNNRLYRYSEHPKSVNGDLLFFDPISAFESTQDTLLEKALKTLTQLAPLPDLDFIVTYADGTREGYYLTERKEDQAPLFGWAKLRTTPFLILIPDWRSFSTWWFNDIRKIKEGKNYQGKRIPWEEKKESAFWRGQLTNAVRLRICQISNERPDSIDAGLCFEKETPEELIHLSKKGASYEEHLEYKYLPVIDGVMCTFPGYQWRLLSDSVPFKQESDQIQWFYRGLKPYVHYVPVEDDLSDLIEKIGWAKNEDETCREIALRSTQFADANLMFEDIYSYFYLALKKYSEYQDFGKFDLWKNTVRDPHWVCIQNRAPSTFSLKSLKSYVTFRLKYWL